MARPAKVPAFAVVRIDNFQGEVASRDITVTKVLGSLEEATAEVARLDGEAVRQGRAEVTTYVWMPTRISGDLARRFRQPA